MEPPTIIAPKSERRMPTPLYRSDKKLKLPDIPELLDNFERDLERICKEQVKPGDNLSANICFSQEGEGLIMSRGTGPYINDNYDLRSFRGYYLEAITEIREKLKNMGANPEQNYQIEIKFMKILPPSKDDISQGS